ncbi:MAG: DNA recombination protein RmuC [Planctomycetota bacterium]|nr:MAG: DNA recombination protein RmuC [Planctomycetota bacterium]
MTALAITLGLLAAIFLALALWLYTQRARHVARIASLEQQLADRQALLEQSQRAAEELKTAFDALAGKALSQASEQLVKLASERLGAEQEKARGELEVRKQAVESLLAPIRESLKRTSEQLQQLEVQREGAYKGLLERVEGMERVSLSLRDEARKLAQALRKPQVRGRYGEMQLQRVVELAGMRQYCDFTTQESLRTDDGLLRPDMLIRLPNDRVVAVDAKTNLEAYLDALEAPDPDQAEAQLRRFADHVFEQVRALSKKGYAQALDRAPEFVVMFIPGDQFIDAALERRPDLLERSVSEGVILASPSTLIGLLHAVHAGWRERQLSEQAEALFTLGKELHERAAVVLEHMRKLGEAVRTTVERYNRLVGSAERRLVPTLRKFEEGGAASGKRPDAPPQVSVAPSLPRSVEPSDAAGAADAPPSA